MELHHASRGESLQVVHVFLLFEGQLIRGSEVGEVVHAAVGAVILARPEGEAEWEGQDWFLRAEVLYTRSGAPSICWRAITDRCVRGLDGTEKGEEEREAG